jgi:hypothetical protein
MMRYPEFWVPLFKDGTEKEKEFTLFALREMLECLVKINVGWITSHPGEFRPIYSTGVRWQNENNTERWLSIPEIYRALSGPGKQPVDCEDLACARAAELRLGMGGHPLGPVRAVADIRGRVVDKNGRIVMHAFVRYPDGSVEDPSKKCGMPGKGADEVEAEAPAKLVTMMQDMRRAA